ncbi:MAG: hypothetical protein AAF871_12725 [Pseudomonadota bacterium]
MLARRIALPRPTLERQPRSLFQRLQAFMALYRDAHKLENMPDHLLSDIGKTPEEVRREAKRLIWDSPAHWRR